MNLSGALFRMSVSTTIPYAIFAGTEVLLPFTMRDAVDDENPSLDADVGILMKYNPEVEVFVVEGEEENKKITYKEDL